MEELYIKCSCHSEGIYLSYDKEDKFYYLSMFILGYRSKGLSFKDKVRWCWHILTKGKPYTDQLVLSKDSAREISNFIKSTSIDI